MTLKNALGAIALDATVQATNTLLNALAKDTTATAGNGLLADIKSGVQALNDSAQTLRRIAQLLKPLGIPHGGGSSRLSVNLFDGTAATIGAVNSVTTVTGVTTVSQVSNQVNMGGLAAYDLMRSNSRTAYNTGIRAKVT